MGDLPNVSGRSKELKGSQTLSSSACTREKKEETSQVQRRFWRGLVWKVRAWVVQEGSEDMGNTPPKFGVGGWGVRCGGQSAVKVTEKENCSHWYSGGSTLDGGK